MNLILTVALLVPITIVSVASMEEDPAKRITLSAINMSNPQDVELLNSILDNMRDRRDSEIAHLSPTLERIIDWFKGEYGDVCFPGILECERSLSLVSEATFWSHNLSLKDFFDKWDYKQVKKFSPLEEMILKSSLLGEATKKVAHKLVQPSMSHEASYALKQAAWIIYKKRVGAEVFDRESSLER
jgi:hypothetical protein